MSEKRRFSRPQRLLGFVTVVVAAVGVAVSGAVGKGGAAAGPAKVGGDGPLVSFLLPENVTARWEGQDKPFFIQAMKRLYPTARVEVQNALNDPSKQQAQAEAALARGAKVLVVTAIDQNGAAVIVNAAKRQNVPVIAYDRLIQKAPVSYYVSVDGIRIGELQGRWLVRNTKQGDRLVVISGSPTDDNARLFAQGYFSVLNPLFKSGARKNVGSTFTPGWEPSRAQQEMEQFLTKNNDRVDGVLSANDGMASGIVAALQARGLAGKVPVTGLDGVASALNLILQRKQSMTVWRSLKEQSSKAAQITAAILRGKQPARSLFGGKTKFNGQVKIPWAPVTPIVITERNMQLEIADGAVTKNQICKGIPRGRGPC